MINNLISPFCLGYFVLCFGKVFAVGVTIRSNGFIELLLLLKSVLSLDVFLLVFRDQVAFQLNFLK